MSDRGGISGYVRSDARLKDFKVTVWVATRYGLRVERSVKVSATGRFNIKALPYGDYLLVAHPEYEETPRFAPASFPEGAGRTGEFLHLNSTDTTEVEIPVTVGGVLKGRLDSIPGSDLSYSSVSLVGPDHIVLRAFARAELDGSGKWRLDGVPPGRWTVRFDPGAAAREWAPTFLGGVVDLQDAQFVEVTAGSTQQVDIAPQRAGAIAGTVRGPVDATMGWNLVVVERWQEPVSWPVIVDSDWQPQMGSQWETIHRLTVSVDTNGKYLFDGLAAGRYRLRVNATTVDNESLWSPYYPDAVWTRDAQTIEVIAGQTTQLEDLQLLRITGHQEPTMTLTGSPEVGATLTATVTDSHPDASIEYSWARDGHRIEDQTSSTYIVTSGDIGTLVSAYVDLEGRGIAGSGRYEMIGARIGDSVTTATHTGVVPLEDVDFAPAPAFGAVLRWIQSNAPAAFGGLRRGESPEAIKAAETALGVQFPADLRTVLGAVGGENQGGTLLPMGHLFNLDELQDESGLQAGESGRHGLPGSTLIPFAGADGCDYCIRIGDGGLDVVFVDDVEGVDDDFRWNTLDDMFGDLLSSLTTGVPFHYFRPAVEQGALTWEITDD